MKAEFTAIIESVPEGGYWAICLEVPGANGQGGTNKQKKFNRNKTMKGYFYV